MPKKVHAAIQYTQDVTMQVPSVKKKSAKQIRENEIVASDRIELLAAANEFVRLMTNKQILPVIHSSVPVEQTELTENETRTYHTALSYLEKQFRHGHIEAQQHEKRTEHEDSWELQ